MDTLKQLDLFVLDNSIRESAVGQLRGHTLEDKIKIYQEVKKCAFTWMLVASLSHTLRVDDDFCQWLIDHDEDRSRLYAFAEISESLKNGAYDTETVPISLRKNKQYGLANTFFEVDLANKDCEWGVKFTMADFCRLLLKWIQWVHNNISKDGCIMVNVRDLPAAMKQAPDRVTELIAFLAQLPADHHVAAFCYEDPIGESLPIELKMWTARMRKAMDSHGWSSGKLLVHVHDKYRMAAAAQIDCLSAGADGVWASLCEEGALVGHASSTSTVILLARLGNEKVLKKYNCRRLRQTASAVSKITTGKDPNPMQPVYGERAGDVVFEDLGTGDFDLAKFFGEEASQRMTTTATAPMIQKRLTSLFGKHAQFNNNEIAQKMKETMDDDLRKGRKEEYQSACGIAVLFARSGGKISAEMMDVIASVPVTDRHHEAIIADVQCLWNQWDTGTQTSDGVLAVIREYDMDPSEFLVYIKWVLYEYPETGTAAEAMVIALEKGINPSMKQRRSDSI